MTNYFVRNRTSDTPARTPPLSVHGELAHFICGKELRTEDVMKLSRRKGRRYRRQLKRLKKKQERCNSLGGFEEVFNFHDLYKAGKKCCNGVRWKQSVQQFELRLFSGTAARRRALVNGKYKFAPYTHFMLRERGKTRPIDAPKIQDRQVEKVYTQRVLLPLYLPGMIHNNGASLPGKGFHFSQKMLIRDLHRHFRKYGRKGGIILADAKKFFPNADHDFIFERHRKIIFDKRLRDFGDAVVETVETGMPLGVEPSQAEMIAYPSQLDNYFSAQMRLTGGHYMDDFYFLVPPGCDYKKVIALLHEQAGKNKFVLNPGKTRYISLKKPFRFCKAKYFLTESGHVVKRANKNSMPRNRKKLKSLYKKLRAGKIGIENILASLNGMVAYLENYDEHKNILRLRRKENVLRYAEKI